MSNPDCQPPMQQRPVWAPTYWDCPDCGHAWQIRPLEPYDPAPEYDFGADKGSRNAEWFGRSEEAPWTSDDADLLSVIERLSPNDRARLGEYLIEVWGWDAVDLRRQYNGRWPWLTILVDALRARICRYEDVETVLRVAQDLGTEPPVPADDYSWDGFREPVGSLVSLSPTARDALRRALVRDPLDRDEIARILPDDGDENREWADVLDWLTWDPAAPHLAVRILDSVANK